MTESAKLRIPYIAASQAQKHVTHNEALTLLDTLVQASVIDKDLTAPPVSPAEGDCYIVAATGTGDWTGWDNRIARFIDGEWRSYLPGAGSGEGWLVYVQDEDALYIFTGSAWQIFAFSGGKGANVASASTVTLGAGGYFHITGTTAITDIDFAVPADGRFAILVFDGALTLTHHATTLTLPGGANIVTAAGDACLVVQDAADNVKVLGYWRANGMPVAASTDGTMVANSDALVPSQKAVKTYTDAASDLRAPFMYCQVAVPTADITIATALQPGQVHDGVTLTNGAPVFVWNQQASPAQNGVWISFDPPFRSPAFLAWANYVGALISVVQGNLYAGSIWQNTNAIGGVLGVSALNFAMRLGSLGQYPFPATQNASSDANTLDDYEEGTFTPALSFATPGTSSFSYTVQEGYYTKIGRVVFVDIALNFTPTIGTGSGNLNITGFPFNFSSDLRSSGIVRSLGATWTWPAGTTQVVTQVNSTTILVMSAQGSAVASAVLGSANMTSGSVHVLRINMYYRVD